MKNRKRTKAIEEMVKDANHFFLMNKVKDYRNSDLFWFIQGYLLSRKMYEGYNFYNIKEVDGKTQLFLSGSATNYDVIQIY